MINRQQLLSDLQKLLQKLEADLLERSMSAEVPEVGVRLKEEHERATKAHRTAQNYEDWRTDAITQAAAAWVLSCVFVRFLEDNRLIDPPKISGPASGGSGQSEGRLERARDEHELYFRQHPKQTDREYLLSIFDQLAKLPGTKDVFGENNPIRELPNWLSGDAAGELLKFFQKIDANTGALVHDFTDSNWDTRFLGDLYQDLSEAARKKYALLQTPEFVEEFILDRTLDPALDEFGLEPPPAPGEEDVSYNSSSRDSKLVTRRFRMIDPACGSGHFLLGSFRRILDRWMKKEPGTNVRELVQRTLDSIHGVDVNPFAIAIARFRLLLAAFKECGVMRLSDAPAFHINVVCGDSLLHAPLATGGKKYTAGQQELDFALASDPEDSDECDHAYRSENLPELKRLLRGGQYHAVVANPPYINVKDKALNEAYRRRYQTCFRQFSVAVPFLERIFRLAVPEGFTGQITTNAFMKAEFGKKLIEDFLPTMDLTHVLDTTGVYLPGHGTPTVILIGRNRRPVAGTIRTVLGIRGEPSTPDDPSQGLVWRAIVEQVDEPGSQSEFVGVEDLPRELFEKHPWSVGGGGAIELKALLHQNAPRILNDLTVSMGRTAHTGEDAVFVAPTAGCWKRLGHRRRSVVPFVEGEVIRDWSIDRCAAALWPYTADGGDIPLEEDIPLANHFWRYRPLLKSRKEFGSLLEELGQSWYGYSRYIHQRFHGVGLPFAFVATGNHFVLDEGEKIFNRTAPAVKFLPTLSPDDCSSILGVLNSSTACFWMKQVCFPKGGDHVGQEGARVRRTGWDERYNFNSTPLAEFPVSSSRPLQRVRQLVETAQRLVTLLPANVLCEAASEAASSCGQPTSQSISPPVRTGLVGGVSAAVQFAHGESDQLRGTLISAQEELDWECYRLYGLVADDLTLREPPPLKLGQRAFEIMLARKMATGETQTAWFERHGSTPITEPPAEWPDDYRQLVERRIELIESDPNIRLIEQPEYKRRWNTEPWESQLERALREWLLNRLEGYFDFDGRMKESVQWSVDSVQEESQSDSSENRKLKTGNPPALAETQLVSVARLASVAGQDADFLQVGELYRDDAAFDVQALVTELVAPECVPLLPVLRYKPTGLRKRAEWEKTWELQREEDRLAALRVAAEERIQKAIKAVRETLGDQKREFESLEQKFREACLSVRDRFAPKVDFTGAESPSVMSRLLGSHGVNFEGGAALSALTSMEKDFESKSAKFNVLVSAALKEDPEYLAAVAAREAIPPNPKIDVPPKYDSKDFLGSDFWRQRGKLDVPKERWISFPHCEGPDGTPMLCWAGYDHLQQARAISAYFVQVQTEFGGTADPRLIPLLACLIELLPWLKQWHNDLDPEFNMSMGDYFEGFINEEARQLGKTIQDIREWTPPAKTSGRGKRRRST